MVSVLLSLVSVGRAAGLSEVAGKVGMLVMNGVVVKDREFSSVTGVRLEGCSELLA